MWDPKQDDQEEEEDSWEVRAFAEDTCNVMGTTWPPRSYTCTFCRREFRSAQALGGHMNVHRRDRAKLHQLQPHLSSISSTILPTTSSTHLMASRELSGSGDLCFLYQLPVQSHALSCLTLNSGSSYLPYNLVSASLPVGASSYTNCLCCCGKVEPVENLVSIGSDDNKKIDKERMGAAVEDVDLELRLGHLPTRP